MRICRIIGALAASAVAIGVPAAVANATPRGPADLQQDAVIQSIWWSDMLDTTPAGHYSTSPLGCDARQPGKLRNFYLPVNVGPAIDGDPMSITLNCDVSQGRPVVLDLGGFIPFEDNNFDSTDPFTYWLIGTEKVPFTASNLGRICDDIIATDIGEFSTSTARLDGRLLSKTLVVTPNFDLQPRPGNLLGAYEESIELGHRGRLAAAYCGYKAKITNLSRGLHRLVLTVGASGRTIRYNIHVR